MRGRRRAAGTRPDRGQASVELALVLPVVALVLLAVVQVGLVAWAQVLVVHAAREGARAAAVDPSPGTAAAAAGSAFEHDGRLEVEVRATSGPGGRVTVEVRYRMPTGVPLIGALVGDVVLAAEATMRVE